MTEKVTADGLRRRRVCTRVQAPVHDLRDDSVRPALKVAKRDGEARSRSTARSCSNRCSAWPRIARPCRDEDLRRISRDIEATLVDSGRKSIAWNDIVALALERLRNVDPIAAQRLAANYIDESGAVRFDAAPPSDESPQLGLKLVEED